MNLIEEKENIFFNLISDTVADIVKEKNFFTSTSLKIKYCFKNMSKIRVDIFYSNDNSGKVNQKSSIISFLLTPENELTDVHVEFENCRNFDLNKETLEELDSKVKGEIDSLFKMSDLTYAKVRVLTGNAKKKSFDRFLDLLNATLEDIFKDSDTKPWVVNGEIYSIPDRILIKVILENGSLFDCYVSHDNKVSVSTYRFDFRGPVDSEQVNSELERKLPSLLEFSGLDFKKLNKLAQKMAKERADSFDDTLVTERHHKSIEKVEAPSKEFKKFKKFKKILDEFLQKIAEDYDGLQISIGSINYKYPARIEVWAENKNENSNKNIALNKDENARFYDFYDDFYDDDLPFDDLPYDDLYEYLPDFDRSNLKIISFSINPYRSGHYILDVDVSLEKCLNGISYDSLQEEDVKVRKALPELLLKADLHFSDVEEWTSLEFEYPKEQGTDGFEKRLYNYLSQFDIINSDLLQHMCFGCAKSEDEVITVDVFSDDPSEPKALLRFNYEGEDYISVDIGCELIKNYKRLSAKKYREVLDILDMIKKEIVFLLNYNYLYYDYWNAGFPSPEDTSIYIDDIESFYIFNEGSLGDNVYGFDDGSPDKFESIEDINDEE